MTSAMTAGRVTAVATALLASTSATTAFGEPCLVSGVQVSVEDIRVGDGRDPATVSVRDVAATAVIPRRGGTARLEVEGAIAFAGTRRRLWLAVKASVTVANGTVELEPGALVVATRSLGDDVIGTVVLHASDVMAGEDKPPDEAVGEVRIPCAALSLDWAGWDDTVGGHLSEGVPGSDDDLERSDDAQEPRSGGDGSWWRSRRGRLVLHARPDARAARTVLSEPDGDGPLEVERLDQRGGWMRVVRTAAATRVTGWVRRSALTRMAEAGGGRAGGCTGDHGHGMRGRTVSLSPRAVYQGPATIAVGTALHDDDGRTWATVRQADGFEVRAVAGEPWATVTAIPGVTDLGLWPQVPASSVTIAAP